MGLQFLFMDDHAPCHRTVAAEQLLESRRLAARTLPPVTIRELRLALQDEWAAMPKQLIDTLILSMGRRCETCLAAELLVYCFNTVSVVVKFTERLKSWLSFFQLKVSDASEYLGLNAELNPIDTSINYKKASDNDHCKKTSSNDIKSICVEDSKPNQKLTLWIQMTLSKLSVVVLGKLSSSCNHDNFKLQFDAEEIVSSYDFQEVYSKMIMKLSSLSINCFVKPLEAGRSQIQICKESTLMPSIVFKGSPVADCLVLRCFHTTGLRLKPWTGQGRFSLSFLQ
ncbi:vacuolar protein sorting-associated protein 13B [Trichonephila clavipes]|nr:vacuolar protein sorting-associated protein 13B [Trichonephila clavipes]